MSTLDAAERNPNSFLQATHEGEEAGGSNPLWWGQKGREEGRAGTRQEGKEGRSLVSNPDSTVTR